MARTETILTPEKVAKRLGVCKQTLANWRAKKKGPSYYKQSNVINAKVYYKLKDVKRFEKSYLCGDVKVTI